MLKPAFLAKASVPQNFGAIPEARLRGLTQQQAQAHGPGGGDAPLVKGQT